MLSNGFSVRISSKLQCRFHAQVYLVNKILILCGFDFGVCACVCMFVLLFHSSVFLEFLLCFTCYFFILIFVFLFYEDGKEREGTERKGRGE